MKLVRNCDVPVKRTCCYILVKSLDEAYQWMEIPKVPKASACRSFFQFIYGSTKEYSSARASINLPQTGKLSVLEDSKMHYIVITDPAYKNAKKLKTGGRISLTPKMKQLITPTQLGVPRKKLLTDAVASSAILSDYTGFKHIASGTVGEVFSMSRQGKLFVAKLQHLRTRDELRGFAQEVKVQRAFAAKHVGLPLVDVQVFKLGTETVAVVVMPLVQTLHEFLHTERTAAQLDLVMKSLVTLLSRMQEAKLTHGDLTLFNMYIEDKPSGLKVLDFDRSSTKVFAPDVDVLRAATELSPDTRSEPPDHKPIHVFNSQYLESKGLQSFQEAFGSEFELDGSVKEIDANWEISYDTYCHRAHVKCLE